MGGQTSHAFSKYSNRSRHHKCFEIDIFRSHSESAPQNTANKPVYEIDFEKSPKTRAPYCVALSHYARYPLTYLYPGRGPHSRWPASITTFRYCGTLARGTADNTHHDLPRTIRPEFLRENLFTSLQLCQFMSTDYQN